jgi:hypothetical protein
MAKLSPERFRRVPGGDAIPPAAEPGASHFGRVTERAGTLLYVALFALAALVVPAYLQALSRHKLQTCQANLKNIASALELYGADHPGHLPPQLSGLCPEYLRRVPHCPAANRDTYSESFELQNSNDPDLPPSFRLSCSGGHHLGLAEADAPAYDSEQGLQKPTP